MEFAPLQINGSPFRPIQTSVPGQELIHVRTLYLERRYKQCIALCDDLLKPEVGCLLYPFLWET